MIHDDITNKLECGCRGTSQTVVSFVLVEQLSASISYSSIKTKYNVGSTKRTSDDENVDGIINPTFFESNYQRGISGGPGEGGKVQEVSTDASDG